MIGRVRDLADPPRRRFRHGEVVIALLADLLRHPDFASRVLGVVVSELVALPVDVGEE